jgi:hypothetical protein
MCVCEQEKQDILQLGNNSAGLSGLRLQERVTFAHNLRLFLTTTDYPSVNILLLLISECHRRINIFAVIAPSGRLI